MSPSTTNKALLMKLDCLSCSVIPPILSTGVLYNSLMVIVTNNPPPPPCFLPRLPSHTLTRQTVWISARVHSSMHVTKVHVGARTGGTCAQSRAPFNHSCNVMKHAVIKHSSGGFSAARAGFHQQPPRILCSSPVLS